MISYKSFASKKEESFGTKTWKVLARNMQHVRLCKIVRKLVNSAKILLVLIGADSSQKFGEWQPRYHSQRKL